MDDPAVVEVRDRTLDPKLVASVAAKPGGPQAFIELESKIGEFGPPP